MTTEPRPRDFLAPRSDASRRERQWAAIERGLDTRSGWAFWRRLFGDVVPGSPFYTRPAFALAVVALLSVGGAFGAIALGRSPRADVASRSTTPTTLTLADGSTIRAEAGAKLETPTNEPMHVVTVLREGSAHFEVVPNRARSFTVVADGVEVRVVGTAFSVTTDPATRRTTVRVDHGIVEVRAPSLRGEVRRLTAGEVWTSGEDAQPAASSDAPDATAAASSEPAPSASATSEPSPGGSSPPSATDDARALYEAANRARRAGDVSRAAALYRDFLRKHPDDPRAQVAALELGRLEMEKGGDPAAAERALETASSATPGSAVHEDALAHLVDVYAQKGDLAACKKAQAQYLGTYPKGVHAAQVRSRCGAD